MKRILTLLIFVCLAFFAKAQQNVLVNLDGRYIQMEMDTAALAALDDSVLVLKTLIQNNTGVDLRTFDTVIYVGTVFEHPNYSVSDWVVPDPVDTVSFNDKLIEGAFYDVATVPRTRLVFDETMLTGVTYSLWFANVTDSCVVYFPDSTYGGGGIVDSLVLKTPGVIPIAKTSVLSGSPIRYWIGVASESSGGGSSADNSITNEGLLSVFPGTSETAVVRSNTFGSNDITFQAGSNVSISESGNTITIASSGGAGGGLSAADSAWVLSEIEDTSMLGTVKSLMRLSVPNLDTHLLPPFFEFRVTDGVTVDTTDHLLHSSLVYTPNFPYKYYLVGAPFSPWGVRWENPTLGASNDLIGWEAPGSLINPIEGPPASVGDNHSDPDLWFDGDTLHLIYNRTWGDRDGHEIRYTSSVNGETWSTPVTLRDSVQIIANGSQRLSPSISKLPNGSWVMYSVDITNTPNLITKWTASSITGDWSLVDTLDIDLSGDEAWHVEVKYHEGVYVMLVMSNEFNGGGIGNGLYLGYSLDGTNFEMSTKKLIGKGGSGAWDDNIYRSSLLLYRDSVTNTIQAKLAYTSNQFANVAIIDLLNPDRDLWGRDSGAIYSLNPIAVGGSYDSQNSTYDLQVFSDEQSSAGGGVLLKNSNDGPNASTRFQMENDADETANFTFLSSTNTGLSGANSLNIVNSSNDVGIWAGGNQFLFDNAGNLSLGGVKSPGGNHQKLYYLQTSNGRIGSNFVNNATGASAGAVYTLGNSEAEIAAWMRLNSVNGSYGAGNGSLNLASVLNRPMGFLTNQDLRFVIASDGAMIHGGKSVDMTGTNSSNYDFEFLGHDGIAPPFGNTSQRPVGKAGVFRWNTDSTAYEHHDGSQWVSGMGGGSSGSVSTDGFTGWVSPGASYVMDFNNQAVHTFAFNASGLSVLSLSDLNTLEGATYSVLFSNVSDSLKIALPDSTGSGIGGGVLLDTVTIYNDRDVLIWSDIAPLDSLSRIVGVSGASSSAAGAILPDSAYKAVTGSVTTLDWEDPSFDEGYTTIRIDSSVSEYSPVFSGIDAGRVKRVRHARTDTITVNWPGNAYRASDYAPLQNTATKFPTKSGYSVSYDGVDNEYLVDIPVSDSLYNTSILAGLIQTSIYTPNQNPTKTGSTWTNTSFPDPATDFVMVFDSLEFTSFDNGSSGNRFNIATVYVQDDDTGNYQTGLFLSTNNGNWTTEYFVGGGPSLIDNRLASSIFTLNQPHQVVVSFDYGATSTIAVWIDNEFSYSVEFTDEILTEINTLRPIWEGTLGDVLNGTPTISVYGGQNLTSQIPN